MILSVGGIELYRKPKPEPVIDPNAPPKPKMSGAHCRLCKYFKGDDPRGAMWAEKGECNAYPTPQKVQPEFHCSHFLFNETLRDGNR